MAIQELKKRMPDVESIAIVLENKENINLSRNINNDIDDPRKTTDRRQRNLSFDGSTFRIRENPEEEHEKQLLYEDLQVLQLYK